MVPYLVRAFDGNATVFVQDNPTDLGAPLQPDEARYCGDHPSNCHPWRCRVLLERLVNGSPITMGIYEHRFRRCTSEVTLEPKPLVLVEGQYTGRRWLGPMVDCTVYVEMSAYGRMMRRAFRNLFERHRTSPGRTIASFLGRVQPAHQRFVVPQRVSADSIVEVPYAFEHTCARFGLQPMAEYGDRPLREIVVNGHETHVTLVRSHEGSTYLEVRMGARPYACIPLSEQTCAALMVADLSVM